MSEGLTGGTRVAGTRPRRGHIETARERLGAEVRLHRHEAPMAIAFMQFGEAELHQALMRLRLQAAAVRALLDELDRIAPPEGAGSAGALDAEQLVEEVARLGRRMLECAAALTAVRRPSDTIAVARPAHEVEVEVAAASAREDRMASRVPPKARTSAPRSLSRIRAR